MDLQMPVMDGYTATRAAREEFGFDMPIIAMTAHIQESERYKCLQAGMDAYLSKPIEPDLLWSTLLRWRGRLPKKSMVVVPAPMESSDIKALPDSLPGINIAGGLKRMMDNQSLFVEVFRQFIDDQRDVITRIQTKLDEGSIEEAERIVHGLKGVSGTVSADDVYAAATMLDDILRQKEMAEIEPAMQQLRLAIDVVMESVTHLPEILPEEEQPISLTLDQISPLVRDLDQSLRNNNLNARRQFESLKSALTGVEFFPELKSLEDNLNHLEFKEARKNLKKVAGLLGFKLI
jgi:CheY-like chemotaxis protein